MTKRDCKDEQLEQHRRKNTGEGQPLTEESGVKVTNDERNLRAGKRGPLLMQDFHLYKKLTHFTREKIPEKIVHARGFGVYGEFETYESMKDYTMAHFLQQPGQKTPVFVRFSNFTGNKGSKDTAVDIRGFAVKFYTEEGNYDSLALQFPVFILADAMKFMDVAHAAQPNLRTHMPQASVAHDNFWDYVVSNKESAHMVMWLMSMRGRPRSWRMMEAFPINTFRFINEKGVSTFVRFMWKPKLGVHSLLLQEANEIGGADPDYHRRDIIDAIENGQYPEYELGVQLIAEKDEFKFDFDILDDTKLWPEEEIPPKFIGKMTLNRLMDNFYAENEQSAFNPANVVPGIEFSNDPVLQGRSIAYRDTELYRHNSPNYEQIPVNRPINEVTNNFRNGRMNQRIDVDHTHFHDNSQSDHTPQEVSPADGGYENYSTPVEGMVTREHPSDSFTDYYTQARIFWNSLSTPEKQDLIESFSFHLGSVRSQDIREKNVEMWANVDEGMAATIADNIGVARPTNKQVKAEKSYPSLSQSTTPSNAATRKVAVIVGENFHSEQLQEMLKQLLDHDVMLDIISATLQEQVGDNGATVQPNKTFTTAHPALYDALYVVGGQAKNQKQFDGYVEEYIASHYKYLKPIAIAGGQEHYLENFVSETAPGIVLGANNTKFAEQFLENIAKGRFWERTQ